MPQLLYAGSASHSLTGRTGRTSKFDGVEERNVGTFSRILPSIDVRIIICGPTAFHCFAVAHDGTLFAWGRNENFELGFDDDVNRYQPTPVKGIKGMVAGGACGQGHSVLFLADGGALACGDNETGQCGIGKDSATQITFADVNLSDEIRLCSASAGRGFSVAVATSGEVFAWGTPENGVLGNGSEGKSLERAGKYTYLYRRSPIMIKGLSGMCKVASGNSHTLAMDKEGKIWSWGFGGYGRLGHGDAKDQFAPTPIALFHFVPPPPNPNIPVFAQRVAPKIRAIDIVCGGTCSYALVAEPHNALYFWGITKASGEATLKPTHYDATGSWKLSAVGAGSTSSIVISQKERAIASWGPGPTHGELGYGEGDKVPKSSTKIKEVESLNGALITNVVMGYGCALLLVDVEDQASKAVVETAPVFLPDELSVGKSGKRGGGGASSSSSSGAAAASSTTTAASEKPAKKGRKA